MSEKDDRSEKKKNFWTGEEYTQHYDKDGNKTGKSKDKENFWTDEKYTQHYDKDGNKTGKSKDKENFWTDEKYKQHYDRADNKTGKSKDKENFWTDEKYKQHYDQEGNKTGRSYRKEDFWTDKEYTEHKGQNNYSSSYSRSSSSSSDDGSELIWWLVKWGVIVTVIITIVTYALIIGALMFPVVGLVLYFLNYKRKEWWLTAAFVLSTYYFIDIWSEKGIFIGLFKDDYGTFKGFSYLYFLLSGVSLFFLTKNIILPYLKSKKPFYVKDDKQENLVLIGSVVGIYLITLLFKLDVTSKINSNYIENRSVELSPPALNFTESQDYSEETVTYSAKQEERMQTQASISDNFYIVNVYAAKTEDEAKRRVSALQDEGYPSSYLWIPDYNSLSGAKLYSVYIGPFKSIEECATETENYRKQDPSVYGLLVSNENKRVEIRSKTDIQTIEPYK